MLLCKKDCICSLCRQLKSISERKMPKTSSSNDNFSFGGACIKSEDINFKKCSSKKFTFFGMEVDLENGDFEKFSTVGKSNRRKAKKKNHQVNEIDNVKHKSVIYVNNIGDSTSNDCKEDLCIKSTEKIDNELWLEFVDLDQCKVLNVIYKRTFAYACQLIDEISINSYEFYPDDDDDFPLGMEADRIFQYLKEQRYWSTTLKKNFEKSYHLPRQ